MRFDDSLDTVLSAEISSRGGVESAWRQIVDLVGRRRAVDEPRAIARLRAIRGDVPTPVRAASARGLERTDPPAALVALFVRDEPAVAAPVIRSARLSVDEWVAMLPTMRPETRSLLRHRRDLAPGVVRALGSYGASDLVLGGGMPERDDAPRADDAVASGGASGEEPIVEAARNEEPASQPMVVVDPDHEGSVVAGPTANGAPTGPDAAAFQTVAPSSPFVSIGDAARELPVVLAAKRYAQETPAASPGGAFPIAELMERIAAYQRDGDTPAAAPQPAPRTERFRFETDAAGVIRWVDGAERSAVVGIALDTGAGPARVDGVAAGAFRKRARFTDARLEIGGTSPAAGAWRISAVPGFDAASGRFTGYRGTARRPRIDEDAAARAGHVQAGDSLRQLVHELRTPTNAIAGFAEMIERELLGPVPPAYRASARAIRQQTHELIAAIDDLDLAARIESRRLDLGRDAVAIAPMLEDIVADLASLAALRGATLAICGDAAVVEGDARAVERLLSRLLATLVAASADGERIGIRVAAARDAVTLAIDRPRALAGHAGDALFDTDDEVEGERPGAPLLGSGFAFRLARKLATELGGALVTGSERLTLRLRAAVDAGVEQASV